MFLNHYSWLVQNNETLPEKTIPTPPNGAVEYKNFVRYAWLLECVLLKTWFEIVIGILENLSAYISPGFDTDGTWQCCS